MACLVPGVVLLQPLAACRVLQHPGMTARPVLYPRTWLWLQSDRFSPQSLEVGILYISRGSFCRLQACFADRGRLLRVVVVLSAWADCLAEDICMRAQAPARPPRPVFLRKPAWLSGSRLAVRRPTSGDALLRDSEARTATYYGQRSACSVCVVEAGAVSFYACGVGFSRNGIRCAHSCFNSDAPLASLVALLGGLPRLRLRLDPLEVPWCRRCCKPKVMGRLGYWSRALALRPR